MRFGSAFTLHVLALALVLRAQAPAAPASSLELTLEPENVQEGLPQAFRFLLINRSDHSLTVPEPMLECSASDTGNVWLRKHFVPFGPKSDGSGYGCNADMYKWPGIMERVKYSKILHPGESIEFVGDSKNLFLDYHEAGTYEFWGEYDPPSISSEDQLVLKREGIDMPHQKLSSNHMTFIKKS